MQGRRVWFGQAFTVTPTAGIDDVLAHHATGACPAYTRFLTSFADRGILVRCAPG